MSSLDASSIAQGDFVTLSSQVLPEHRGREAVVTAISSAHCTVAILDDTGRRVVGECWPDFRDVSVRSSVGRLGRRVAITRLQSRRTSWCNGLTGVVVRHPCEGHPCFVRSGTEDDPLLVFCLELDAPPSGRPRKVMMEARFLEPYVEVLEQAVLDLSDCSLRCGLQAPQSAGPCPHIVAGTQDAGRPHTLHVATPLAQAICMLQSIGREGVVGLAMERMLTAHELGKIGSPAVLFADPLLLVRLMFRLIAFAAWRRFLFGALPPMPFPGEAGWKVL